MLYPSIHPAYWLISSSSACIPSHLQAPICPQDLKLPFFMGPNPGDSNVATTMYECLVNTLSGVSDGSFWATTYVCMLKESVDVDGWPVAGSRIEKSKKIEISKRTWLSRSDLQAKKWWRSTYLVSGLALIWHSRPLSVLSSTGGLQRCGELNIAPVKSGDSLFLSQSSSLYWCRPLLFLKIRRTAYS